MKDALFEKRVRAAGAYAAEHNISNFAIDLRLVELHREAVDLHLDYSLDEIKRLYYKGAAEYLYKSGA